LPPQPGPTEQLIHCLQTLFRNFDSP
jgi:hypothetical protein